MTARVNRVNSVNPVNRAVTPLRSFLPSPFRLLPSRLPLSSQLSALILSIVLLSLYSSAGDPKVYLGQTVTNVAVTLTGPVERLLVLAEDTDPPTYIYAASGSYGVDGEKDEEELELTVVKTYTWEVDETIAEIIAGGGPNDKSVTIRFRAGQEDDTKVSVTYAVTVNGVGNEGWSDTATVDVVVPYWDKDGSGDEPDCTMACPDGIVSPADGTRVLIGTEIPLQLGTITDYDARTDSAGTTYHNDPDQLRVTWTASEGSFKDEIDTGTSVVWIAPQTAQNDITIAVNIADRPHGPERERYTARQESFEIDKSITVSTYCTYSVTSVKVRRQGTEDEYGTSATIAAGGLDSDVHKALLEFTLDPVPEGAFAVTVPVAVANADGYPNDSLPAKLYIGNAEEPVLTGSGILNVTFSSTDAVPGKRYATLVSSNLCTTCTVGSASIDFAWDCSGEYDFRFPEYFVVGQEDDVEAFLTLDEVADKDTDGDGVAGEGAIGGHNLTHYTASVTVEYWKFDFTTLTYTTAPTEQTFECPEGAGPTDFAVMYGATVNDLVEHSSTIQPATGQYVNGQTVKHYMVLTDGGTSLAAVVVLEYGFAIVDSSLHMAP